MKMLMLIGLGILLFWFLMLLGSLVFLMLALLVCALVIQKTMKIILKPPIPNRNPREFPNRRPAIFPAILFVPIWLCLLVVFNWAFLRGPETPPNPTVLNSPRMVINSVIENLTMDPQLRFVEFEPSKTESTPLLQPGRIALKSAPCMEKAKARIEVISQLRPLLASHLHKYRDSGLVQEAANRLADQIEFDENYKEVAGDRYPIYTGRLNVTLDDQFDRQLIPILNRRTAQNRFVWLLKGSIMIIAMLLVLDQVCLGRSWSRGPKTDVNQAMA